MAGPYDQIVSDLDAFLRQKGSPLAGYGSVFVTAGQKHGVDPRLLVSIAGAESSFGKQNSGSNNPFGYGPGRDFPSFPAAIDTVASDLGRNYIGAGLKTVPQIAGRWAPVGAANDPANLNSNWTRNVTSFLSELRAPLDVGAPAPPSAVETPMVPPPAGVSPPRSVAQPSLGAVGRGEPPRGSSTPFMSPQLLGLLNQNNRLLGLPQLNLPAPMVNPLPDHPTPATNRRAARLKVDVTHDQPVSPLAPSIVQLAKKWLGTPYSWGGGSPSGPTYGTGRGAGTKGFDCSAFAQYLYAQEGVKIPRVTYDQWKVGTPVADPKQLAAGDLVFFRPGPKGPEHVGIYLSGGQFVEAPGTGLTIRVSSLDGRKDYMGGRRVE